MSKTMFIDNEELPPKTYPTNALSVVSESDLAVFGENQAYSKTLLGFNSEINHPLPEELDVPKTSTFVPLMPEMLEHRDLLLSTQKPNLLVRATYLSIEHGGLCLMPQTVTTMRTILGRCINNSNEPMSSQFDLYWPEQLKDFQISSFYYLNIQLMGYHESDSIKTKLLNDWNLGVLERTSIFLELV